MTEKSKSKVSQKTQPITIASSPPAIRRGRPKGSKNKPKISQTIEIVKPVTIQQVKRGRPKGAKNKPKVSPVTESVKPIVVEKKRSRKPEVEKPSIPPKKRGRPFKIPQSTVPIVKAQKPAQDVQLEDHPLLKAVKWLEKYMHPSEMQYYRNRANKLGVSLSVAMASDILGLFNVQNPEICKQIKKNNFIAINNNSYDLHQ